VVRVHSSTYEKPCKSGLFCVKAAWLGLPQPEAVAHGVEVVGMMFFDDNTFVLRGGDLLGECLASTG
jgi:hypothetical protein